MHYDYEVTLKLESLILLRPRDKFGLALESNANVTDFLFFHFFSKRGVRSDPTSSVVHCLIINVFLEAYRRFLKLLTLDHRRFPKIAIVNLQSTH